MQRDITAARASGFIPEANGQETVGRAEEMIGVALAFMLMIAALICSIGAIVHRNPGKSFWEIYGRGSLYREGDLSPSGWQLHFASRVLAILGLLLGLGSMCVM